MLVGLKVTLTVQEAPAGNVGPAFEQDEFGPSQTGQLCEAT
jgi:hypothetical protein